MKVIEISQMAEVNGGFLKKNKDKKVEKVEEKAKEQANRELPKVVNTPEECGVVYPRAVQPTHKQAIHFRVCVGETQAGLPHHVIQDGPNSEGGPDNTGNNGL